ncbi:hypothetical protein DL93DRAFT_1321057 [Clavulina sp. PMI_390]|nr:hypothetical protein DL93DRAFT_1321057 [Clavulina sp. PMI_390]
MLWLDLPLESSNFLRRYQLLSLLGLVTSVCSRWRSVAISTAKLWTWLLIGTTRPVESQQSMIETFLRRSLNASLHVFISGPDKAISEWHLDFLRLYEVVQPHLQRCSIFCFYHIREEIIPKIFPLPLMPRLRTIYLYGRALKVPPVTLFADRASYVQMKDATSFGVPVVPLIDNTIEKLVLVEGRGSQQIWALPLIASSLRITSLDLSIGGTLGGTASFTPIYLPHLTYLRQWGRSLDFILDAPVLDQLDWIGMEPRLLDDLVSFPSVSKLHVERPQNLGDFWGSQRQHFHFPALRSLVFEDIDDRASDDCNPIPQAGKPLTEENTRV